MEEKAKEKKKMNLDQKLMELKRIVRVMQKDSQGHGYNYVSEENILLAINNKMIELGLKLTPRFKPGTLYSEVVNYQNAKGQPKTDILVRSEIEFVWKDIETGEMEIIDWALLGQQADGSQALGSGLTYANRYFLLKYFNVATSNDDPDKIRSEMAKAEERKKISAIQTKIKKAFDQAIQKFQTKDEVYTALGITREQFLEDYNNPEKQDALFEQISLILKGDK